MNADYYLLVVMMYNSNNTNNEYISSNPTKEAYLYNRHLDDIGLSSDTKSAKVRILPNVFNYIREYDPKRNSAYTMTQEMSKVFMNQAKEPDKMPDIEDFEQSEIELSEDKVKLILGEIEGRENLKDDNIQSLYDDLFRVYNWRNCRHFPENDVPDKIWSELNKMELDIRDKIRRELKDSVRDTSFPQKDLRESLLEFKMKNTESHMLGGGLEMELDNSDKEIENYMGDKTGAYRT